MQHRRVVPFLACVGRPRGAGKGRRKKRHQHLACRRAQCLDDDKSGLLGARWRGVRAIGEEELPADALFADGLVAAGDEIIEIQEGGAGRLGHRARPGNEVVRRSDHPPVLPVVARHQGAEDRRRALRARVRHVLAQVPPEAVNDLCPAGGRHDDFLRVVADTGQRAARPAGIERSSVVVAELDQHVVAALDVLQHLIPESLGLEGAAAAPAEGAVHHPDLRRVEVVRDGRAPAELAWRVVLHRRIADEKQ